MKLSDESLLKAGLSDIEMVRLFRAFLVLYDINPTKLKEINSFYGVKKKINFSCSNRLEIKKYKKVGKLNLASFLNIRTMHKT